jgi:hypothetical protein
MIFVALLILLAFALFAGIGLAHKNRARGSPPMDHPAIPMSLIEKRSLPSRTASLRDRLRSVGALMHLPATPANGLSAGGVAA